MISNEVKEMDAYKFEQEDKIKNPVYDNNFIFGNLYQNNINEEIEQVSKINLNYFSS